MSSSKDLRQNARAPNDADKLPDMEAEEEEEEENHSRTLPETPTA